MSPQLLDVSAALPPVFDLGRSRDTLWENGWVVLENFLSDEIIAALEVEAEELQAGVPVGKVPTSVTTEEGDLLVMNSLDTRSEFLFDVIRSPRFCSAAEVLCGKAVVPIHAELFSKPHPGTAATPPHQDQVFYQDHFTEEAAITFWCPLNDVAEGDGVLEYVRAENRELLEHRLSDSRDFGRELVSSAGLHFEPVSLKRGDVVVHHAFTVHRSGPMTSETPRRAYAFNYRTSSFRQGLAPHRDRGEHAT